MPFQSHASDEAAGHCRALYWYGGHVALCNQPTRRPDHHYCRSCWGLLFESLGRPPEFPPFDGEAETRYCIGDRRVFSLGPSQRNEYFGVDGPRPRAGSATNEALYVGRVKKSRLWEENDQAHAAKGGRWNIYVLRMGDGSYYIGQSRKPPEERYQEHANGQGANVCRERGVEKLVYYTEVANRQIALEAELFLSQTLKKMGMNVSIGQPDSA